MNVIIKNSPYHLISHLPTMNLANQHVLLRADLNVPIDNGKIFSPFRLQAIKPTLDLLLQKKATILIVTHLGRPQNREPNLSTQQLIPWFNAHNYDISFAQTIEDAKKLFEQKKQLILLENIRFWPGEKKEDHQLAEQLKSFTDIYVMDAFGAAHRTDTSIMLLPTLYAPDKRTIGLLVQKELQELNKLLIKPKQPFVLFLGGAKLETKLPLIGHLLDKVETIALLPALSFTFERACGKSVGNSLVEESLIPEAKKILEMAQKLHKKIVLPADYLVSENGWEEAKTIIAADKFKSTQKGFGIGPQTVKKYEPYIKTAQTIFFNGLPGELGYPNTLKETAHLFNLFCTNQAYKIAAGGDSTAAIEQFNLEKCFNFLSTGGGATLAYLSGQALPGLSVYE